MRPCKHPRSNKLPLPPAQRAVHKGRSQPGHGSAQTHGHQGVAANSNAFETQEGRLGVEDDTRMESALDDAAEN